MADKVGVPRNLKWALVIGEWERLSSLGCFSRTTIVPLKNGVGDCSKEDQELQIVRASSLEGGEIGTSLLTSCRDAKHSYMEVVPYSAQGLKENEPLMVHPLAIIKESGLPEFMSSDWVSCKGFEDKMLALFITIEASQNRMIRVVLQA